MHTFKIVDGAHKLNDMDIPMTDQYIVHMALNSLPTYSASLSKSKSPTTLRKEKWIMNDLIFHLRSRRRGVKKCQYVACLPS